MIESIVVDAISDQMDQFAALTRWLVPLVIILLYSATTDNKEVKVMGIEISKEFTILISDIIVTFYFIAMMISASRMNDLFKNLTTKDGVLEGFSNIATHDWILNPYSMMLENSNVFYSLISIILLSIIPVFCIDMGTHIGDSLEIVADSKLSLRKIVMIDSFVSLMNIIWAGATSYTMFKTLDVISERLSSLDVATGLDLSEYKIPWIAFHLIALSISISLSLWFSRLYAKNSMTKQLSEEAEKIFKKSNK